MDPAIIETLQQAGIRTDFGPDASVLRIGIRVDEDGRALPITDEIFVTDGKHDAFVTPKAITELFEGSVKPPRFTPAPPPEYQWHFYLIEQTAAEYCSITGVKVRDKEFEDLYGHLRRRPDGWHDDPLFSYLQAGARLVLSLFDVSEAEYEAVVKRLMHAARTFSLGATSMNYRNLVLNKLIRDPAGRASGKRP